MEQKKWWQFVKMVIGISSTTVGIAIFGGSQGKLELLIIGSLLAGIGLAILFTE